MKAEIYDEKSDKTIRKYIKKDSAIWCPKSESHWKRNPYIELCFENTPKKGQVVIVKIPFKEIRKLINLK